MTALLPHSSVDVLERDSKGRFTGKISRPWYEFLRDFKSSTVGGDMPVSIGSVGAQIQESLGMSSAALIRASAPRITPIGTGIWLVQNDTAANIANYPASLFNPGIYLASDTFGIYRSDGTGWTLMAFISDTAYGVGWNGVTNLSPSQNAVYDKIQALLGSSAYTPSNVTTDRSYDANATTIDELADALGTLIADLQGKGILS